MSRIPALALWLFLSAAASADDLLYASDGKQLFTVDLQTGALTFISDGPLQWIASPAFDEEHHTRLWIEGVPTDFGGMGIHWTVADGVQFSWGNPFTGESGGPYPAALSYNNAISRWPSLVFFTVDIVYAPTTQRLYTMGVDFAYGQPSYVPLLIDQYNGAVLPGWGNFPERFWDIEFTTTLAFDSTSGMILVAYAGSSGGMDHGYGVRTLDPVFGVGGMNYFSYRSSTDPTTLFHPRHPGFSKAMAVEPSSGDLYYLRVEGEGFPDETIALVRRERSTGEETVITDQQTGITALPLDPWSLRFLDAKYAR